MKEGDKVYVTTDRYSPWLGLGAEGIVTVCEPEADYYEIEFDDDRLYHLTSEDIVPTNPTGRKPDVVEEETS